MSQAIAWGTNTIYWEGQPPWPDRPPYVAGATGFSMDIFAYNGATFGLTEPHTGTPVIVTHMRTPPESTVSQFVATYELDAVNPEIYLQWDSYDTTPVAGTHVLTAVGATGAFPKALVFVLAPDGWYGTASCYETDAEVPKSSFWAFHTNTEEQP